MLHVPVSRNPAGVDELVRRYQIDRDERARDKLLRQYMPIIKSAANRWANHWGVNRDDAIQEASLGFLRALETYDPLVASLEGYARLWMRSKIGYARRAELTVAVPAHAFNDAGTVGRATYKLRQRYGRRASLEEIAAETGLTMGRAETALAARSMPYRVASTETPLGADENLTLGDTLRADDAERPDRVVEESNNIAAVRVAIDAALASFVPRHREAMTLRLLDGLLLEEVGARMGVTKERVRQIELKALPRLREILVGHPAVAALLGREPAPVEVDDDTSKLLNVAEVEARTGLDRKEMAERIGHGAFPRPVAADNRGNRLWRDATVERWLQRPDGKAMGGRLLSQECPQIRDAPSPT